jgi:hypothetical protein
MERIEKLNKNFEENELSVLNRNNKLYTILHKISETLDDEEEIKILQRLLNSEIGKNKEYLKSSKCDILRKINKIKINF